MSVLRTEKMHQIYFGFCVILSLICGCSAKIYKEGEAVTVLCNPKQTGTVTFMLRISSKGASLIFTAKQSSIKDIDEEKYTGKAEQDNSVRLDIKSFSKTDSAVYTCATMNSNKLFFGEVTEIRGEPDPTTQAPKTTMPVVTTSTTKSQCKCKVPKPMLKCDTWILSSLACGCGFLLFLLIFTILYCNRLRTRRCPHHYKRQPQSRPAGHPKLPNTHF